MCFSGGKLAIENTLFWLKKTCAKKDPKYSTSSSRETRISEHLPAHLFSAPACTTQPNYHKLSPYLKRYNTSASKCNVFQSLMLCSDWQLAIKLYDCISCKMLLYLTMDILHDVSYIIQRTAGPFEHLLKTKILNRIAKHWLLGVGTSQTDQVHIWIHIVIIPPFNIHMERKGGRAKEGRIDVDL